MGNFNFIPLPNAIPTAAKTSTGAKLETDGSLAPQANGKSFQTLLTQAGEKIKPEQSGKSVAFNELPKELQQIIREKFGIQKDGDVQLIQLPANAVRVDENGELRISIDEIESLLQQKNLADNENKFHFIDIKNLEKNSGNKESGDGEINRSNLVNLNSLEQMNSEEKISKNTNEDAKTKSAIPSESGLNNNTHEFLSLSEQAKNASSDELQSTTEKIAENVKKNIAGLSSNGDTVKLTNGKPEDQAALGKFGVKQQIEVAETKQSDLNKNERNLESGKPNAPKESGLFSSETSKKEGVNPTQFQSNSSQVIYFRNPQSNGIQADVKVSKSIEVTGDMAEELAKMQNKKEGEKSDFLVVKSPVQSDKTNEKPVLFLINTKDLQAEQQKSAAVKGEGLAEKISQLNGEIKMNFAGSENSGQDNKNDGRDQHNKSQKFVALSESGLQLSRSINQQAESKDGEGSSKLKFHEVTAQEVKKQDGKAQDINTEQTLKTQIQSHANQTALETKTPAQTAASNTTSESGNTSNSTTVNTASVSQSGETSSQSSTQQSSSTQSAAKPSTPQEIPQAYKDAAAQQIVKGVQSSLGSERSHISIRLVPESLGKVDIQLKMENGMMTAHIVAEKESTHAMLEKNTSMLKLALEEKNIQIDKVQIGRDSNEFRNQQQEQNKTSDRWKQYQDEQHKEQNQSRREQREQQQNGSQQDGQKGYNPWQTISEYMDRMFQRS